jgi:hypothetical protein
MAPKRKDSGYCPSDSSSSSDGEVKARDFALSHQAATAKYIPRKVGTEVSGKNGSSAKTAQTASLTIRAGKDDGNVWQRIKVTAMSRLGGKV